MLEVVEPLIESFALTLQKVVFDFKMPLLLFEKLS